MEYKPHNYQAYCIERIVNDEAVGLFLRPGLGKTSITLSAINILKYYRWSICKALVIAPKKVAEGTWSKEAAKWDHLQHLQVSTVLGSEKKRMAALNAAADIYVINRENVTWLVDLYRDQWPFDMVVVDEFSSFKSHSAKRFKSLAAIRPHVSRFVGLTGTPSPNGLMDLWSELYLLDGGERLEKRFGAFRERYFRPGRSNGYVVYEYLPRKGSREAILGKISDICISMKADDYLTLPDCIDDEVPVVLDKQARKAYNTLERQMVLELDDEDLTVTSAAALSNKLIQLANGALYDANRGVHEIHSAKIDALMELLESLNGKPALLFYSFQHDKWRILAALRKTKLRVRTLNSLADQDAWNAGEVDVLLAHPASCAYGLNLQAGGNHIVWFGLPWNYEQYVQANKRLHRQGQTEKVIVHHLVVQDSRDEDVMKALGKKEKAQDYVLESLKARIEKYRSDQR